MNTDPAGVTAVTSQLPSTTKGRMSDANGTRRAPEAGPLCGRFDGGRSEGSAAQQAEWSGSSAYAVEVRLKLPD